MDLILKLCVTSGRSPDFTVNGIILVVLEDKNQNLMDFEFDLWCFVVSPGSLVKGQGKWSDWKQNLEFCGSL